VEGKGKNLSKKESVLTGRVSNFLGLEDKSETLLRNFTPIERNLLFITRNVGQANNVNC
jgi:hypothetical protein